MMMRGVRGAITVPVNTADAILGSTRELLEVMVAENNIVEEDVASVIFTITPDLNTAYPAKAARQMGWTGVALMGSMEMDVIDGLVRCIRILIHWNTDKSQNEIRHVFLRDARSLRPDLVKNIIEGDQK